MLIPWGNFGHYCGAQSADGLTGVERDRAPSGARSLERTFTRCYQRFGPRAAAGRSGASFTRSGRPPKGLPLRPWIARDASAPPISTGSKASWSARYHGHWSDQSIEKAIHWHLAENGHVSPGVWLFRARLRRYCSCAVLENLYAFRVLAVIESFSSGSSGRCSQFSSSLIGAPGRRDHSPRRSSWRSISAPRSSRF